MTERHRGVPAYTAVYSVGYSVGVARIMTVAAAVCTSQLS